MHAPYSACPAEIKQSALQLARYALRALHSELILYPKPGLVSLIDSGSHTDMDATTFMRSLFSLRHYFYAIALAGYRGADFTELKTLGIQAEQRMLAATKGVNTHRGAIFILGLLIAGVAACESNQQKDIAAIPECIMQRWGTALQHHIPSQNTHGAQVLQKFHLGGARAEASAGFPSVFQIGLPALKSVRQKSVSLKEAYLNCFFSLLAEVDDSNIVYRCGIEGLVFVKQSAKDFLQQGGVQSNNYYARAHDLHRQFVKQNISPGGTADLLAASIFLFHWEQDKWA